MVDTSVVIPVRNGARFVAEALGSVLCQLDRDDEVLVVDDGSTDPTVDQVRGVADGRIRLLDAGGRGVSAARNVGLAAARGDFVAFLDHDDLWPPERHAILRTALVAHPDCGAAFGRVSVRFETDAPDRVAEAMDGRHVGELVGTALYRRCSILPVGGFNEAMRYQEDAEFHQRLVEARLDLRFEPCISLIYRRHGDNVTNDILAVRRSFLDLARRKLGRTARAAPPAQG